MDWTTLCLRQGGAGSRSHLPSFCADPLIARVASYEGLSSPHWPCSAVLVCPLVELEEAWEEEGGEEKRVKGREVRRRGGRGEWSKG